MVCDTRRTENPLALVMGSVIIEHEIPTRKPLYEMVEDIEKYVYQCLIHKVCVITGRKGANLRHAEDRVGMGGNRKTMIHEGMRVMPLSREFHTLCHTMSQEDFNERFHIVSIRATKEICKKWGLRYECE